MRRLSLGLLALLLVALPAQAQDFTGQSDYTGSSTGTVNTPFFQFDVWTNGVYQGNWDMVCVDATRYLNTGLNNVEFWSLSNISGLLGSGTNQLEYDLVGLQRAAAAYSLIQGNADYQGSRGAQYALWSLNGTLGSYNPANLTGDNALHYGQITTAVNGMFAAGTPNLDFSNYYLMVARRSDGTIYSQPQLTHRVGVPEPGSAALMAVGMLALGVVGVRRREKQVFEA